MAISKILKDIPINAENEAIKLLREVYKEALKDVNKQIEKYRIADEKNFGKKRLTGIRKARKDQRKLLRRTINDRLKELQIQEQNIITNFQVSVYKDVYYQSGYLFAKDIVKIDKLWGSVGHVSLNDRAIKQIFKKEIGNKALLKVPNITKRHLSTLQRSIRKEVGKAIITGISEKELTQRLKNIDSAFNSVFARAQATARTEVFRAHSFANSESINNAKSSGLGGDEVWDAVLDNRTRLDHRRMEGRKKKKRGKNKGYFILPNGERALYPRDPNLSAEQSINCRCLVEFRILGFEPTTKFVRFSNNKVKFLNRKDISEDKRFAAWRRGLPLNE